VLKIYQWNGKKEDVDWKLDDCLPEISDSDRERSPPAQGGIEPVPAEFMDETQWLKIVS
jgi:hypothetical protein